MSMKSQTFYGKILKSNAVTNMNEQNMELFTDVSVDTRTKHVASTIALLFPHAVVLRNMRDWNEFVGQLVNVLGQDIELYRDLLHLVARKRRELR